MTSETMKPSVDFLEGMLRVLYAVEELTLRGETRVPVKVLVHEEIATAYQEPGMKQVHDLVRPREVELKSYLVKGLWENIFHQLDKMGCYRLVDSFARDACHQLLLQLQEDKRFAGLQDVLEEYKDEAILQRQVTVGRDRQ